MIVSMKEEEEQLVTRPGYESSTSSEEDECYKQDPTPEEIIPVCCTCLVWVMITFMILFAVVTCGYVLIHRDEPLGCCLVKLPLNMALLVVDCVMRVTAPGTPPPFAYVRYFPGCQSSTETYEDEAVVAFYHQVRGWHYLDQSKTPAISTE